MASVGEPPRRRSFLKLLTAGIGAAIGALATIPGLGMLAHPLRRSTVSGGEEPIRVGSATDLAPGEPTRARVVGNRRDAWLRLDRIRLGACWLVKTEKGQIRAFSTVCPHLGCSIDWNGNSKRFECPCHESVFDAAGRRVSGPSPRDMDELEVRKDGDAVSVVYRRFRIASPGKEPLG